MMCVCVNDVCLCVNDVCVCVCVRVNGVCVEALTYKAITPVRR
jgi:hypothetical protein